MIVEQVLLISAAVSGGSVAIVGGINYIKNTLTSTVLQWKPYKHKGYIVNLDDLDAEDIYNEPFMYKHDLSNIAVEPLIQD